MKLITKPIWIAIAVNVCLSFWSLPADAQRRAPKKYPAVFAAANLNEQFDDLIYLAKAADVPEIPAFIQIFKVQLEGGLDFTKPIGGYMPVPAEEKKVVWFVPTTNFDGLLNIFGGGRRKEEVGKGVFKITPAGPDGQFAKVEGGYAFFASDAKHLSVLSMAPAAALGGLDKTYNAAVQFNMQLLPDKFKKELVAELTKGFADAVGALKNVNRESSELAQQFGAKLIGTATRLIQETDLILLGLAVDAESKRVYLDFDVTGTKGSQLARQLERLREARSKFNGFAIENSLLSFNFVETIPNSDVELYKLTLAAIKSQLEKSLQDEESLNDNQRAALQELLGAVFTSLAKTTENGKLDAGGAIILSPQNKITAAAGVGVKDTAALDKTLRRVAGRLLGNGAAELKLNVATHGGVRFHSVSLPLPDDNESRKFFGERADFVIGFGEEAVYLAIGDAGLATLKQAIDQSSKLADKVVPAVNIKLSIGALLKLTAVVENKPELANLVKEVLAAGQKDKITLTSKSVPRGLTARIQVDEGVLRIIGRAARQGLQPAGAGGDF